MNYIVFPNDVSEILSPLNGNKIIENNTKFQSDR